MPAKQPLKVGAKAPPVAAEPAIQIPKEEASPKETVSPGRAIAKYQGAGDWGPKYGLIHCLTILGDWTRPHRLVAGTTTSIRIVEELGGYEPGAIQLDKLVKGDLIYPAKGPTSI